MNLNFCKSHRHTVIGARSLRVAARRNGAGIVALVAEVKVGIAVLALQAQEMRIKISKLFFSCSGFKIPIFLWEF